MSDQAYTYMDWPGIESIIYCEEASPKDILAPRMVPEGVLIQGFFPDAVSAETVAGRKSYPMEREDEAGYYAVIIPGKRIPKYRFRVTYRACVKEFADPYAFSAGYFRAFASSFSVMISSISRPVTFAIRKQYIMTSASSSRISLVSACSGVSSPSRTPVGNSHT